MKKRIIPITDLRKTNEISSMIKDGEPIFVTKNGYSDMVIMSHECFEEITSRNIPFDNRENKTIHFNKKLEQNTHCHGLIHVGAYSIPVSVGNVKENVKEIKKGIDLAYKNEISILTFPELSITGYTCGDLFVQASLYDEVKKGIEDIKNYSKDKDILIIVGAPIFYMDAIYNCAITIQNGKILGISPKKYIPNYKEFYESRYFSPYNKPNTTIIYNDEEIPFGNHLLYQNDCYINEIIGVEICEDAWISHSPSLDHTDSGATIIINLSSSNEVAGKSDVRRNLVNELSRRLNCVYIYCSSSYEESTTDLLFSGACIISECGDSINETSSFFPTNLEATIDISRIKNKRRQLTTFQPTSSIPYYISHYQIKRKMPTHLKNRYISTYPFIYSDFSKKPVDALEILKMQALGLVKRLKAINCKKVVLGLSGGLDSSLALLVCHQAFEILNYNFNDIICITLPCFGTTKRTYENALKLTSPLGVTLLEINITDSVLQHLKDIDHLDHNYDVTFENAQARERTKVLMDYSNKVNGIVIGTGDLSEIALGWSTYNGDHMSMYAVNSSIPKTLIRFMIQELSKTKYNILKDVLLDILDTPISPELIPSSSDVIEQKTEDIIGPYELHDFFLYHYINECFSFTKIDFLAQLTFKNVYNKTTIRRWLKVFISRFFRNQFKRSCMPDSIKVTSVSLSPRGDLRLPSDVNYQSFIDEIDNLD